VYLHQ